LVRYGSLARTWFGDLAPLGLGCVGVVLGEGGGDERRHHTPSALACMGKRVAHEVHAAARRRRQSSRATDPRRRSYPAAHEGRCCRRSSWWSPDRGCWSQPNPTGDPAMATRCGYWPAYARLVAFASTGQLPTAPKPAPGTSPRPRRETAAAT
jgi:hypothetical protein